MNFFFRLLPFAFVASCTSNLQSSHDAEEVFHILKKLPHDCYTFENEKYTFEYCHLEHARQMLNQKQGNTRQEWDIGHYLPDKSVQKYCPFHGTTKITLENGAPCPEAHHERKTKVKFRCVNPNLSMHIVNVIEKSMCNYRIYVHVPELCFK